MVICLRGYSRLLASGLLILATHFTFMCICASLPRYLQMYAGGSSFLITKPATHFSARSCLSASGPHDGIGAVVKKKLRLGERAGVRITNAQTAAAYLKQQLTAPADDAEGIARRKEFLANWTPYRIKSFEIIHGRRGE